MPIPMIKPYTIAMVGKNDAEINMYGEVVKRRPDDWRTGKAAEGNYIVLDEFLADLDNLKSKDNITIHINSVGGDFYAGLAIYNRLRNLPASITTINDSLAASAGSIIFMAGDKGKRKAYAASNLMVHGVLTLLWGYYNVNDLQTEINELESHNKAAIAAYMEATDLDEETIKEALSKDTYMTGQEAVDAGWADEVISSEGNAMNMMLTPDKSMLMCGGHTVAACLFGKLPDSIQQMSEEEWAKLSAPQNSMQPAPQADINHNPNGGNDMEIKNIEEMRSAYPEFVAQVEAAARVEGANAERERIQGIENIQNAIGDADLIRNAKYGEKPMNAAELALAAMQKQAAIGATVLTNMQTDATNSGTGAVAAAPANNQEGDPETPEAIMAQAKKDAEAFKAMNNKEVR